MRVEADRRTINYEDAVPGEVATEELVEGWREAELRLARRFAETDRSRSYIASGCSSAVQFALRLGLAREEATRLIGLGRAIAAQPCVEERIRSRALSASAAAVLDPVLSPGMPQEDLSRWLDLAAHRPLPALRRDVRRDLAARDAGEMVVDVTVHVTETVREDFERARIIASRRARRFLTYGDTFRLIVDHYLATYDPLRTSEGSRRVGPTAERPGDRYVPISVRRAVTRRAGDRCEHPGCDRRVFTEFAHLTPHRDGGAREVDDLVLLCRRHHVMLDGGHIALVGPVDDAVWVHRSGVVVTAANPVGRDAQSEAERRALRTLVEAQTSEDPGHHESRCASNVSERLAPGWGVRAARDSGDNRRAPRLPTRRAGLLPLADVLHQEHQRGVRADCRRGAACAVSEFRRDDEDVLGAGAHQLKALVPALHDPP